MSTYAQQDDEKLSQWELKPLPYGIMFELAKPIHYATRLLGERT